MDEERDQREGAQIGREVEVSLIPDQTEVIEEADERRGDEEHEREIGQVVEGRVVDHRPVEHRRVEVVGDVRIHAQEELARGLLDHQGPVVYVGVGPARLSQDDRDDGRHDDEDRDDRGEVGHARARAEAGTRAKIAERIGHREDAAGGQERDVGERREQLPERDVARRRDRRVVGEQQEPVPDAKDDHEPRVERETAPRLQGRFPQALEPLCDHQTDSP